MSKKPDLVNMSKGMTAEAMRKTKKHIQTASLEVAIDKLSKDEFRAVVHFGMLLASDGQLGLKLLGKLAK